MSLAYGAPFISGKDSLNNEFEVDGKPIAIPHTLLISAIGIMPDVARTVSMDFKAPGNDIYIVGETRAELGGSEYFKQHGFTGNRVPKVDGPRAKALMQSLSQATGAGLVRACHDCSEGGIGVALAEMAFAGGLGAEIELGAVPLGESVGRDDFILFSESNSRFLVEVAPAKLAAFEAAMAGSVCARIGRVTGSGIVEVTGTDGRKVVAAGIHDLKEAWQRPLRWEVEYGESENTGPPCSGNQLRW
jgi:phosphoribosylformylglycinamidine synthase